MESERKYQIGKFSELSGISVRTLRYYDDVNVLKPEIVDEFSGYRYYTDHNLKDAELVNLLKYLNFSLEEIVKYKNDITADLLQYKIEQNNDMIRDLEDKNNVLAEMREQCLITSKPKVKKLVNDEIAC